MNFIDRYSTFSKWFYAIVLSLAVPFYLLLNGTSGHPFDPSVVDIVGMTAIVLAAVVAVVFFTMKDKSRATNGIMKIIFVVTVLLMAVGGLKIFVSMLLFEFEDGNFLVRVVSCGVPAAFVFSSVIVFIGLFRNAPAK